MAEILDRAERTEAKRAASFVPEDLDHLSDGFEERPAQDVLRWALERYRPRIALACSFGAEDVALVDMLSRIDPTTMIFYLDTGALFPETYELVERVTRRYRVQPLRVTPAVTLADQTRLYGDALWERQLDLCCYLRKVQPLTTVLRPLSAWITGIRRQQTPARASAGIIEWDDEFGLVKVNPLARWTDGDVWKYIAENEVPYNPLHDRGYPSIGCTHCSRPVTPGEHPRAGRWPGTHKTECGLHERPAAS